jgi:hypothetical protein
MLSRLRRYIRGFAGWRRHVDCENTASACTAEGYSRDYGGRRGAFVSNKNPSAERVPRSNLSLALRRGRRSVASTSSITINNRRQSCPLS